MLETRPGLSKKERLARAENLLERFKITRVRNSGQRSRCPAVKRRLQRSPARSCTEPRLLMLDEPFAGIDPIAVEDIKAIVRELRERDELAILITDHSVRRTLSIV